MQKIKGKHNLQRFESALEKHYGSPWGGRGGNICQLSDIISAAKSDGIDSILETCADPFPLPASSHRHSSHHFRRCGVTAAAEVAPTVAT